MVRYHKLYSDDDNDMDLGERRRLRGDPEVSDSQELVGGEKRPRWQKLGVCILAVGIVTTLVVVSIVFLSNSRQLGTVQPRTGAPFSLEEVIMGDFIPSIFNGTWISGSEFCYSDKPRGVLVHNVKTQVTRTLVPSKALKALPSVVDYKVSPNQKYVMFAYSPSKLFRHSYLALYAIYDVEKGTTSPLTPNSNDTPHQLMYAHWRPGTSAIVFVYNADIYYLSSPSASQVLRITTTGNTGPVLNGIPDWVYEEEVLGANGAMWFSKDGKKLAFASFNDSEVNTMRYPFYGTPGVSQFQYPLITSIKYPKAGRTNPTVDLYAVDMDDVEQRNASLVKFLPPKELRARDHYFTIVGWMDNQTATILWMNRHQNLTLLSLCSANSGACVEGLRQESPDKAWNDLYDAPVFSADLSQFLLILPKYEASSGYFKHLHLIDRSSGKRKALTAGEYVVNRISAWDHERQAIYFEATPEGKPHQNHLYQISSTPGAGQPKCLTCDLSQNNKKPCAYVQASFSTDSSYFVLTCKGPDIPYVRVYEAFTNRLQHVINDNERIRKAMAVKVNPEVKRLEIPITGGYKAQVVMTLPPTYQDGQKYPLLVHTYGGPDSNMGKDVFRVKWAQYLTTNKSIIYATIDGRGSGNQGEKLLHELYRRLGSVEVEDQIVVTKELVKMFSFIDAERTAIWGWSYGGYVTGMAMARDTEGVFKCGISVAPVTSWLYYDTIYTERYMGLPTREDNQKGYNDSDLTRQVENFRHKFYLLIHGTADDNVHYQQSMLLAKVLEEKDILFRQQSYPDESHGLTGVKKHHYHTMGAFLDECFQLGRHNR